VPEEIIVRIAGSCNAASGLLQKSAGLCSPWCHREGDAMEKKNRCCAPEFEPILEEEKPPHKDEET
jgi:hypothetical protein